jgi:hypothetical protein
MADFTAAQLENAFNSALAFYVDKGGVLDQSIQDKPLMKALEAKAKEFPGGNRAIERRVVGDYTTTLMGYLNDDTVSYGNPTNTKVISYQWKELHAGIKVPFTELKIDGISVTDSATGKSTSDHSGADVQRLAGIFEQKLADMAEGYARDFNSMLWQDGTQDAKEVPGILSFILDDPTSATIVAGIDQSTNTWWRNRASLLLSVTTPSDCVISNKLQTEMRQLRKFGGKPSRGFAGSAFIEALEKEIRSKGNFTLDGFTKKQDPSMGDISFKGVPIDYDPTLDDLGRSKYLYLLDESTIQLMPMSGEARKMHNPARPEDKYVLYRAMTWTGGLCCWKRNANGVYSIV